MSSVHAFFNTTKNYLHQSFGIRIRAEIVNELIGNPIKSKILDVGCGNGGVSSQFIMVNEITFLDLSENMINLVKENLPREAHTHANFIVGPFPDVNINTNFDYILAIGLLAHVPSVSNCIGKLSDLLNPGGFVIIQFSDYNSWLTRLNIRQADHYGYPINKLSYQNLKEVVMGHGFKISKEIRFSFLLPGMGKLPDNLLYKYSKLIWKSTFLSRLGTDYIWLLTK